MLQDYNALGQKFSSLAAEFEALSRKPVEEDEDLTPNALVIRGLDSSELTALYTATRAHACTGRRKMLCHIEG